MFLEIVDDGVLVFDAPAIVRVPEVLHLPCPVDFLCHRVIEVSIEQKDVILAVSGFSELRGNVFLRPL